MTEPMDAMAGRAAARAAKKEAMLAAKAAFDALPATERWAGFERIGMLLHQQEWIFAKTMPQNPHWYSLRRKWQVDADFQWVIEQLRARGYRSKFGKTWYSQLDVNDHFYWTMGFPINWPNGMACTILINRKPLYGLVGHSPAYDAIADRYDPTANDADVIAGTFGAIGNMQDLSVLEIGCGTGHALQYAELAGRYLGIDPSLRMLERLAQRHPDASTICTTLVSFAPPDGERYDLILALFGTGSYLTDVELERIPLLLKPGGTAWVQFYAPGTTPGSPIEAMRPWCKGLFPGKAVLDGGFVMCQYRKP